VFVLRVSRLEYWPMPEFRSVLLMLSILMVLPNWFAGSINSRDSGKTQRPVSTFCNPLNLDYGSFRSGSRSAADPVIVLFQGKYYLFTTSEFAGYRVSDDLLSWKRIYFEPDTLHLLPPGGRYVAAGVAAQGDYLYFVQHQPVKTTDKTVSILRTRDPLSGKWEKFSEVRRCPDADLFVDDDGRVYLYYGLGSPLRVLELDRSTWTEIPGSDRVVRPWITELTALKGGFERGRREVFDEVDVGHLPGRFQMPPCQEGGWMTKHGGRYYFQYATPGTVSQWYCDGLLEGSSPVGPFREAEYAPVSLKAGGFIGGAGHSSVFQDKNSNWWRVTTMWIGVLDLFERRIGLFPVRFDDEGRMQTDTAFGDYPTVLPPGSGQDSGSVRTGWWLQSFGKPCTASSALPERRPESASDENVRTWWSAETGQPGEWLAIDLQQPRVVTAVQVNFAEQDCKDTAEALRHDYHQYTLLASQDGQKWRTVLDRRDNRTSVPHDYVQLESPESYRYLKLVNRHAAREGKFAVRDLRVFGPGERSHPARIQSVTVRRHRDDDRNVSIAWKPSPEATGYLFRYGIAADKLYQCIQVQGGTRSELTVHTLMHGVRYWYRVDAFNDSGVTPGQTFDESP